LAGAAEFVVTRAFLVIRALIYGAGFVAVWGWLALQAERRFGGALPAVPRALGTPGMLLMVAGGLVAVWCVATFVFSGRGTPAPFDAPRVFVATGPYRWVRNPMYIGALLVLAGFGVWRGSLAVMLFAIPAALAAHLFVRFYEEPTLTRRFGMEYLTYQALVNRWVPKRPAQ
jgi:protein-S-isoprenylcysteine O-methyltransferase Ste14